MGQQKKGRDRSRPFNSLYPTCFRHWDTQICKSSEAYLLISKQLTFCPQKVTKTGLWSYPSSKNFASSGNFAIFAR